MKKTIVTVLALVLVLSCSMVALVACNNDDNSASNTEVLGTAVALAAQSLTTGASAAEESADDFQAGINLNLNSNIFPDQINAMVSASLTGVRDIISPAIESVVNKVDKLIGENGIKIESSSESDKDGYSEKITISGSYIDEATGEEKTYSYNLYVGINGGEDIDGKKDYTFKALIVIPMGDEEISCDFSGNATYDKSTGTMTFTLSDGSNKTYANAFAGIKAYSKKDGSVVIELSSEAGILKQINVAATVSIEFGKIDDNGYGAIVTVDFDGSFSDYGTTFTAVLNVYANSTENAGEFNITGNVTANINAPIFGEYKASANLEGKAQYDAENDQLIVGVSGNVSLEQVEKE